MAKSTDIPTDLHAVTTRAHAHFSLAIDLNGCDARFVRPEEEDLPTKMSVICEQTEVNQLSAQPSYVDQNAKVAPLQRPDVSKMTVPKGDAPFPSALAEFSAPNIIFGDNCRQAEFIASTISSRARDGAVQFIPQTMCIANHPAPGILEYYFEVKLLKLPRPNGLGVGFRSNLGDWVLGSDGRKWSVSRRAFSEDALVPGTYLDVLDQSQLCPSWEPVRVMDVAGPAGSPADINVSWLHYKSSNSQLPRNSGFFAPFCSHTAGCSPLEPDRTYGDFTQAFHQGDIIGAGVNLRDGSMFFTKNGEVIGNAETEIVFTDIPLIDLWPAVEFRASAAKVEVNFGSKPFAFQGLKTTDQVSEMLGKGLYEDEKWMKRVDDAMNIQAVHDKQAAEEKKRRADQDAEKMATRLRSAQEIIAMGLFPGIAEALIMKALENYGDDVTRTVNWAFEQPDAYSAFQSLANDDEEEHLEDDEANEDGDEDGSNANPPAESGAAYQSLQSPKAAKDLIELKEEIEVKQPCPTKEPPALNTADALRTLVLAPAHALAYCGVNGEAGSGSGGVHHNFEVQEWLNDVGRGLRRARMGDSSIDQILNRLKRNPRDMVALLQAREVIPHLRDAPRPLQHTEQHLIPSERELQAGTRVHVIADAKSFVAAEQWTPLMSRCVGLSAVVVDVDRDPLCPSALLRVVTPEYDLVPESWWPLEVLRVVRFERRDAFVGSMGYTACVRALIESQNQMCSSFAADALSILFASEHVSSPTYLMPKQIFEVTSAKHVLFGPGKKVLNCPGSVSTSLVLECPKSSQLKRQLSKLSRGNIVGLFADLLSSATQCIKKESIEIEPPVCDAEEEFVEVFDFSVSRGARSMVVTFLNKTKPKSCGDAHSVVEFYGTATGTQLLARACGRCSPPIVLHTNRVWVTSRSKEPCDHIVISPVPWELGLIQHLIDTNCNGVFGKFSDALVSCPDLTRSLHLATLSQLTSLLFAMFCPILPPPISECLVDRVSMILERAREDLLESQRTDLVIFARNLRNKLVVMHGVETDDTNKMQPSTRVSSLTQSLWRCSIAFERAGIPFGEWSPPDWYSESVTTADLLAGLAAGRPFPKSFTSKFLPERFPSSAQQDGDQAETSECFSPESLKKQKSIRLKKDLFPQQSPRTPWSLSDDIKLVQAIHSVADKVRIEPTKLDIGICYLLRTPAESEPEAERTGPGGPGDEAGQPTENEPSGDPVIRECKLPDSDDSRTRRVRPLTAASVHLRAILSHLTVVALRNVRSLPTGYSWEEFICEHLLAIQVFNRNVRALLPLIPLFGGRDDSTESDQAPTTGESELLRSCGPVGHDFCRSIDFLLCDVQAEFLHGLLDNTASSHRDPFPISIHRLMASNVTKESETVFRQAQQRLSKVKPSHLRTSFTPATGSKPDIPFLIEFKDEKVVGADGPYRAFFSDVCSELQQVDAREEYAPHLFCATPNRAGGLGMNRELITISPGRSLPSDLEAFRFVGILMGVALRSRVLLSLELARLFWTLLGGDGGAHRMLRPGSLLDGLREMDQVFVNGILKRLSEISTKEEFRENFGDSTLQFSVQLSDGTEFPLSRNPSQGVTFDNRLDFVRLAKRARLGESKHQINAIRAGLGMIVPLELLSIFSADDIRRLICGEPSVDFELLKRHTAYGSSLNEDSPRIIKFWKVVEEFDAEQRRLFVQFVYAQKRLPSESEFERQGLRLLIHPLDARKPDQTFPQASTCFFNLSLPDYSSINQMRRNLLLAITSATGFGTEEEERQLSDMSQNVH
eukprot:138056_1